MSEKSKINSTEDVLSWELFFKGSNSRNKLLPTKSTLDNRLIFETKNLFIIAGLGSFVSGYFLIITKSPYSSFAQLNEQEKSQLTELCESKIDEFLEKRKDPWSHRKKSSGYIKGAVRYRVLSRAKF